MPPSIDARIEVKAVETIKDDNNKVERRYLASPHSKWFPLCDATELLSKLQVVSKDGEKSKPYSQEANNLGQAFQSMKKIDKQNEMEAFAINIENAPYDFVSYRIADGTKAAFLKVSSLLADGNVVFWDRWSLPRRLAERRELVSDAVLDRLLNNKISQSTVVWGIDTPKYCEVDSYSEKEKSLAMSLGKFKYCT